MVRLSTDQRETYTMPLPGLGLPDLETQIEDLLARMEAGDRQAIQEYSLLASKEGWPCWGMTWAEWAALDRKKETMI